MVYGPPGWLRPPGPDPIGANILGSWTGRRVFRGGSRKCRRSASMRRRRSERVDLGMIACSREATTKGRLRELAAARVRSDRGRPGDFHFLPFLSKGFTFLPNGLPNASIAFQKLQKVAKNFRELGLINGLGAALAGKNFRRPAPGRPSVGAPGSGSPRRLDIGRVSRVSPRSSGPRPRDRAPCLFSRTYSEPRAASCQHNLPGSAPRGAETPMRSIVCTEEKEGWRLPRSPTYDQGPHHHPPDQVRGLTRGLLVAMTDRVRRHFICSRRKSRGDDRLGRPLPPAKSGARDSVRGRGRGPKLIRT